MTIAYIFLALLGLGLLVFIHELGHYYVAKWAKMDVEIFSIGFGRPLFRWKRGDVSWQVGWLPFGGYVKIKGMEVAKKDKGEYVDPYSIEGGFFSKSPAKRIAVAIAGPLANFLLAFLVLTVIWISGGREKPFSEFSQIIGWVDPKSELYEKGVRPGDLLYSYDHKPYRTSKDLLYAALFSGKQVELTGAHVDWQTGAKKPFTYTISPYATNKGMKGMMTTGIGNNARYLIYKNEHSLMEGSPMATSGLQPNDRLVWADGEILFSLEQLSDLINCDYAFLTIERGGKQFFSRQPRILITHLLLPPSLREDLIDWHYEAKLKTPFQQMKILPYEITEQGIVASKLSFLDESHFMKDALPLQKGDRILAIDGHPFKGGPEMLPLLQRHQVQMVVQGKVPLSTHENWQEADAFFAKDLPVAVIEKVAASGNQEGTVRRIEPVTPMPFMNFSLTEQAKELLQQQIAAKQKEIQGIKDSVKRETMSRLFDQEQKRKILGVVFEDRQVDYNPSPLVLFGTIFSETWQTLKALLSGNLHPRWLSGPVGIVQVMHHGWQLGVQEALFWIAAISINLGFLNLLPIPVLDGGYICLSLWELITRKRLHPKTIERMIIPFVVLLIGLLIFLTFQDVTRLF